VAKSLLLRSWDERTANTVDKHPRMPMFVVRTTISSNNPVSQLQEIIRSMFLFLFRYISWQFLGILLMCRRNIRNEPRITLNWRSHQGAGGPLTLSLSSLPNPHLIDANPMCIPPWTFIPREQTLWWAKRNHRSDGSGEFHLLLSFPFLLLVLLLPLLLQPLIVTRPPFHRGASIKR